jgi:DNA-directed RNA polymerase subunit RPC12/RpoP
MIKCSFCEQPLLCKTCGKPFRAHRGDTHVAVYQPDMEVACPECQHRLVCKSCGYVYGDDDDSEAEV